MTADSPNEHYSRYSDANAGSGVAGATGSSSECSFSRTWVDMLCVSWDQDQLEKNITRRHSRSHLHNISAFSLASDWESPFERANTDFNLENAMDTGLGSFAEHSLRRISSNESGLIDHGMEDRNERQTNIYSTPETKEIRREEQWLNGLIVIALHSITDTKYIEKLKDALKKIIFRIGTTCSECLMQLHTRSGSSDSKKKHTINQEWLWESTALEDQRAMQSTISVIDEVSGRTDSIPNEFSESKAHSPASRSESKATDGLSIGQLNVVIGRGKSHDRALRPALRCISEILTEELSYLGRK